MKKQTYMGKYLIEEPPVSFQPTLAVLLGQNEAMLVQEIHWLATQYPIAYSPKTGRKERVETRDHDGLVFVRMEPQQFLHEDEGRLRFWSLSTFKRTVAECRRLGVLRIENFNADSWDQTNWYAVDRTRLHELAQERGIGTPIQNDTMQSVTAQNEPIESVNLDGTPIQNEPIESVTSAPSCTKELNNTTNGKNKQQTTDDDFSNSLSDEDRTLLINELVQLRVEVGAAAALVNRAPDEVRRRVAWWKSKDKTDVRKLGAAVRDSIEHPEKWPISTETTTESTQKNGQSISNSKTNGNGKHSPSVDAALAAFDKLSPREQTYVREQVRMQARALHEVMWDLFNQECAKAERALKSGK